MHPAKSVILFTTASGAGYGLLILFAIFDLLGAVPHAPIVTISAFGLGAGLVVIGLVSSTFHLGHPERAWRALTQWRSSWLSREGVLAIVTFAPMALYAYGRLALSGELPAWLALAAAFTVFAALATVFCTAMIYASLRTIPAWANGYTPLGYLAISLATGAVLYNGIAQAYGFGTELAVWVAAILLLAALAVKLLYWKHIQEADTVSTAESATGLAGAGERVHLFEAPHDSANYLMQEMGFRVARTHSARLRRMAILWGFIFPLVGVALAQYGPAATSIIPVSIAILTAAVGITAERFLFFAEAKHVVSLYYGEKAV